MESVIEEWEQSEAYQRDVIEKLRPELQQALANVHDYKQFVQQIIQNMNVILETKYPALELMTKLDRATHEEAAIYWTAVLMDERLDAAYFLESPERIHEPREQRTFRLHGLVLKYVRIYQRRADQQGVTLNVRGISHASIRGNPRALSIIPQTLVDNALKYAPRETSVSIRFSEAAKTVTLEVESFGPQIRPPERKRIFDLFFRAEAARQATTHGTGFGLASAQNVARESGTEIVVSQSKERGPEKTFLTTFGITFDCAPS
jgi:signal transduction histidine kinase